MPDVLIVGSGPAGATVARVLGEILPDGASVLLAEAGPALSDPAGMHLRNLTGPAGRDRGTRLPEVPSDDGASELTWAGQLRRSRPGTSLVEPWRTEFGRDEGMPAAVQMTSVGGMATRWYCACPRPGDGERIPFIEQEAALDYAEELLGVSRGIYPDPLGIQVALSKVFSSVLRPERPLGPLPLAARRADDGTVAWAGIDTILGPLAAVLRLGPDGRGRCEGLELRAHTLCRRLLVNDDKGSGSQNRVTGAELEHLPSGRRYTVPAGAVVVAADALRTPQLLYASGIRPRALGRYLNDQPQVACAVALPGVAGATGTGEHWVPYTEPGHPFHGQVAPVAASPMPPGAGPVPPGDDRRPVAGMGWFCPKDVRAEDRVDFAADETDSRGMPKIVLRYGLTSRDHEMIGRAMSAMTAAADALGTIVPGGEPGSSSAERPSTTRARCAWDHATTGPAYATPTAGCGGWKTCTWPATG